MGCSIELTETDVCFGLQAEVTPLVWDVRFPQKQPFAEQANL
jgi:hypothetical protein